MAIGGERGLIGKDEFSRSLADHPRDQINAVDAFRNRMLDLEPRVDLKEISFAPGDIVDELDRARRGVVDRAAQCQGGVAKLGSGYVVQIGCGRFLDDLLVSSLQRAIALAQGHNLTFAIAEDLDLDMTCAGDKTLQI